MSRKFMVAVTIDHHIGMEGIFVSCDVQMNRIVVFEQITTE
ncbi:MULTISPECIES: hypothetical protein [Sporosarcina]|uniref:Uncharacterized protein n=1 Tax=Sporosarcina contaminans TaxID=633403 RepID=A0ABW3U1B6_9BACL